MTSSLYQRIGPSCPSTKTAMAAFSKEVLNRERNHYVIFTIRTFRVYFRHEKENRIQPSLYKDLNGGLQPLQHTRNITQQHIQYNHEKVFVIPRWIWWESKTVSFPPSSQVTTMLNQKGANRCICWCSGLSTTVTNVCSFIGCTLLAETPTVILSNIQNVSPQQCECFFVHRLNHMLSFFFTPYHFNFQAQKPRPPTSVCDIYSSYPLGIDYRSQVCKGISFNSVG